MQTQHVYTLHSEQECPGFQYVPNLWLHENHLCHWDSLGRNPGCIISPSWPHGAAAKGLGHLEGIRQSTESRIQLNRTTSALQRA